LLRSAARVLVATLQQDNERPGADAAHPHHLASRVDHLEPLEQVAAIIFRGGPVGAELLADHPPDLVGRQTIGGFQVPGRDHNRRLADDPVAPVDQLTELGQRLQTVAGVGLAMVFSAVFSPAWPPWFSFFTFFPFPVFEASAAVRIASMSSSSSRWAY
jgi:hypothetical protein